MLIKEVVNYLENRYPRSNAADFDQERIGLVIGDEDITITNILLTLDLTLEVVKEAIAKKANFIISHHPFIFQPLFKVLFKSAKGQILELMFKHRLSLYSMHTNLDVGINGVNDVLANLLEIKNVQIINNEPILGNYLRYGEIDAIPLIDLAKKVKTQFGLTGVKIIGDPNRLIKKIGIVGGSGAHDEDIDNALKMGLDCYITGEVKLPAAQTAHFNNLAVIEVNHGVEKLVFYPLAKQLEKSLLLYDHIFVSEINTDPLYFL
ncbi:MAG: Nif3-like dinuclear metal center hexameric protein [Bacilli bacterium]